ncbi:hypothetical protein CR513_59075, partial [Mucuna pruriens]
MSHISKARDAAEELKGYLCETIKQIDKLLMVLILQSLHPDYEDVQEQILSSNLITRLFRVLTITKGDGIAVENSAMVASHGRGRSGQGIRGILRNGKGHEYRPADWQRT